MAPISVENPARELPGCPVRLMQLMQVWARPRRSACFDFIIGAAPH